MKQTPGTPSAQFKIYAKGCFHTWFPHIASTKLFLYTVGNNRCGKKYMSIINLLHTELVETSVP